MILLLVFKNLLQSLYNKCISMIWNTENNYFSGKFVYPESIIQDLSRVNNENNDNYMIGIDVIEEDILFRCK